MRLSTLIALAMLGGLSAIAGPARANESAAPDRATDTSTLDNPALRRLRRIGVVVVGPAVPETGAAHEHFCRLLTSGGHTVIDLPNGVSNPEVDAVATVRILPAADTVRLLVEFRGLDGALVQLDPTSEDAPHGSAAGAVTAAPVAVFTIVHPRIPTDVTQPAHLPDVEHLKKTAAAPSFTLGPVAKGTMRVVGGTSLGLGLLSLGFAAGLSTLWSAGCETWALATQQPSGCESDRSLYYIPLGLTAGGAILLIVAAAVPNDPASGAGSGGATDDSQSRVSAVLGGLGDRTRQLSPSLSFSAGYVPGQGGALLLNGRF